MRPEDVGVLRTELVLGKHSGRHAAKQRIGDLGYHLQRRAVEQGVREFQGLGRPQEDDLRCRHRSALAETQISAAPTLWALEAFTCNAGSGTIHSAAVCLWHQDGTICRDASIGDGPVDAVFKAIERITGIEPTLRDYRVQSVTVGEDAQGEERTLSKAEYRGAW